jgi:hypothetical protein
MAPQPKLGTASGARPRKWWTPTLRFLATYYCHNDCALQAPKTSWSSLRTGLVSSVVS